MAMNLALRLAPSRVVFRALFRPVAAAGIAAALNAERENDAVQAMLGLAQAIFDREMEPAGSGNVE